MCFREIMHLLSFMIHVNDAQIYINYLLLSVVHINWVHL